MKWIEVKAVLDGNVNRLDIDLVYSAFYDIGIQGVVIEEPEHDLSEEWGGDAVKPEEYSVTGYIKKDERAKQKCMILEKELCRLKKNSFISIKTIYSSVRETDWTEFWKRCFRPTKIGSRLVVKPTWRRYLCRAEEIIITLDPGMAFGTGCHPTTAMCIEMLEKYLIRGNRVLDVGSGSGILMIAAAKFGARYVMGIDNDEATLNIAKKNLLQNQITSFDLINSDLTKAIKVVKEKFDIAVANILSGVIIELLDEIKDVLSEKGIFICSGILNGNEAQVIEKMQVVGFKNINICKKENWVAVSGLLIRS